MTGAALAFTGFGLIPLALTTLALLMTRVGFVGAANSGSPGRRG